jgi:hypothetical protein
LIPQKRLQAACLKMIVGIDVAAAHIIVLVLVVVLVLEKLY